MPTSADRTVLLKDFPKLVDFRITDEPYPVTHNYYNCAGWTVNQDTPHFRWPPEVRPDLAPVEAIDRFYATRQMSRQTEEPGLEDSGPVIALYALNNLPTHVALRCEADPGWWESKLGLSYRIVHRLDELNGPIYGGIVGFYRGIKHG